MHAYRSIVVLRRRAFIENGMGRQEALLPVMAAHMYIGLMQISKKMFS